MQFDHRVLLIDKPAGLSSFGVVRQVRRAARLAKVGHCGSLDPLATGLLVLCTGQATRIADEFMVLPKRYEARVRFGRATDSYDADGQVTREAPVPALDRGAVQEALQRFTGRIEQRPPMVSAVKVQGKRLYDLARRGQEVERAARAVMVYELALGELGTSHADVVVRCGRGFYVRSLAHELGEVLGVPAHLEALRRVAIGGFSVADAVPPAAVEAALAGGNGPWEEVVGPRALLGIGPALGFLPAVRVREEFEPRLRHGAHPRLDALLDQPAPAGRHRLLSADGSLLLGLVQVEAESRELRLVLVFREPVAAARTEMERA